MRWSLAQLGFGATHIEAVTELEAPVVPLSGDSGVYGVLEAKATPKP